MASVSFLDVTPSPRIKRALSVPEATAGSGGKRQWPLAAGLSLLSSRLKPRFPRR
jgi:hypothetical protein